MTATTALVFYIVEGEPSDPISAMEHHSFVRHGGGVVFLNSAHYQMRPPQAKILEALDHFISLAGWAIGEGFGSSEEESSAEAEVHRKVLERALRVHSTIELVV